jgi:hypothetical protein
MLCQDDIFLYFLLEPTESVFNEMRGVITVSVNMKAIRRESVSRVHHIF